MTDLQSVLEDTSRNVLVLIVYRSPQFIFCNIIFKKYLLCSENLDRIIKNV